MKAISLWQPWAQLWLLSDPDEKVFETRGWVTTYRGPLLVHAAKTRNAEIREFLVSSYVLERLRVHCMRPEDLAFGAIIGKVDLIGCCQMSRMPKPSEREAMAGNWAPDRYAWERGPKPVLFPAAVPYKGAQGLFEVDGV